MPPNPYLPSGLEQLSMMLMNLGAGITAAEASGRSGWAGIAPGAAMYGRAMGQARQNATDQWQQDEIRALRERQFGLQESESKAKQAERDRMQAARENWTPPGMQAPAGPLMGPGSDYFSVTRGLESGNQFVPNALGSGAWGPSQIMPDTWATIATRNPQLGLPFNMRQATPEQYAAAEKALAAMNATDLQASGIQPSSPNLYLAHRLGVGGARKFLGADPNAEISSLFPDWIAQNPDLRTTVGAFRQNAERRYAGVPSPVMPASDGPPQPTMVPRPQLPPEEAARLTQVVRTGQMTPVQADAEARQIIDSLWAAQREQARARDTQAAEMWRYKRGRSDKLSERDEARAQAETKRGDEQSKLKIADENKLRDDFNASSQVKSYRIVVPMLESAKDAATRPTRAADLNLIYAFAKLMDPESVVRESETGMVVASGTVADRLSSYIGQLNGNQMLLPETRKRLIDELDSRFRSIEASYSETEKAYRGIAERRGLNVDNIVTPIRSGTTVGSGTTLQPSQDELKQWAKPAPIRINLRGDKQ